MSIENLDIVTSIQNYIAELERTANVSGGEAAEYAAEASRSGLESLPGERREKLISYCLLIAAKRVRAVTGGSAVRYGAMRLGERILLLPGQGAPAL